jgi:hypothetical protein
VSRKAEICYLESSSIVDEQIGCFHISVENVAVVEVSEALEQLQHVALDLRFLELDIGVVEEAGEIVIHVRRDHVENRALPALGLGPFHCHLFQPQDIIVGEHLQQFDFAEGCYREAVLFIVHQDLFQRIDASSNAMARLVHFAKSSLAELLHELVFADLGASLEAALQV